MVEPNAGSPSAKVDVTIAKDAAQPDAVVKPDDTAAPPAADKDAAATPAADADADTDHKPSGGFDATPLPDLPPGYTVRFTFHRAMNLPISDIGTSSADPYIKATLTTDVPTRHKEDPPMVHRTRTIHRSTEPVWDEDWIVANVPASGFKLKCRLYDEDSSDHDDRLGNVTLEVAHLGDGSDWKDIVHGTYSVKKRMGSKRAYLFKGVTTLFTHSDITPVLDLSVQVLGRTEAPGGRVYTIGPTTWTRHFSPMIGRLTGTLVNKDERQDEEDGKSSKGTQKYDFQSNELQLQGPVPAELYHRYVEFRPIIGVMFSGRGLRGHVLNKALHKQHNRIYHYDSATKYGALDAGTDKATLQFLKLAHFSEGARIFTYIVSLDGIMRFTETGREFGIDMLSKHTMHSDVATYIAFSGEFFIRRRSDRASQSLEPGSPGRPGSSAGSILTRLETKDLEALKDPKELIAHYELVIDNDSGTYRPNKDVLPQLKAFLSHNFPDLRIEAVHWEDKRHQEMKKAQLERKKKEGPGIQMVLNRSPSNSSFSSSDESRLSDMGRASAEEPVKSKKETALDIVEDPSRIKELAFRHKEEGK